MLRQNFFLTHLITAVAVLGLSAPRLSLAVNVADPFPPFVTTNTLDAIECDLLGIDKTKDVSLADLAHHIIIIEFLNVYCHTCRLQVKIFNDLYETILNDPDFAGKVMLLGIAVGNGPDEVDNFKIDYNAKYPILTDPRKRIFYSTGNVQGTPHTYILRKEEKNFIIDYHSGGVPSKERYLATVEDALRGSLYGTQPGNKAPRFSFRSGAATLTEKDFAGRSIVLYFPVVKKYPVPMDIRNTTNQVSILQKIAGAFPPVGVVVFQSPGLGLSRQSGSPAFLLAQPPEADLLSRFGSPDHPTVTIINQYGRIAFRGEAITFDTARDIMEGREYSPKPVLSEAALIELIEKQLSKSGKEILDTQRFVMDNRETVYVTTLLPKRRGLHLFARLERRPSLCDICHDSHFIYLFDQEGTIVDFLPVQLTKSGNIPWDENDLKKIRGTLTGKSIWGAFSFNPQVDAVSSATMSSSLVFEALNEGKDLFSEFKEFKFRQKHWQQGCFDVICGLKQKISLRQKGGAGFVLDDAGLVTVISETEDADCPLQGLFVLMDGEILCSIHGLAGRNCH